MPPADAAPPVHLTGRVLVLAGSTTLATMLCGLLRRSGLEAHAGAPPDGAAFDLVIADPPLAPAGPTPWLALLPAEAAADIPGAAGILRKPVRARELLDAVAQCLPQPDPPQPAAEGGIDLAVIEQFWGSADNAGFRRVAAACADEMRQRLAAIAAAVAADDRRRLLIEAHSAGSAAANVGAMALSRIARALEAGAPHGPAAHLVALAEALADAARRDLPILRRMAAGEPDPGA